MPKLKDLRPNFAPVHDSLIATSTFMPTDALQASFFAAPIKIQGTKTQPKMKTQLKIV